MHKREEIADDQLWLLISEDNQLAFDQAYYRYAGILFAAIYKHIDSRPDAEDLVQEVFLELWEKRHTILIQSSLFNYLYSMARYKALRYIKTHAVKPVGLEVLDTLFNEEGISETQIRKIESVVNEEIARLPQQMKKVYELRTESGMDIKEIAAQLLISPYTVKNHLIRVRKRLRHTVSRLASVLYNIL
jgi:RNA polymerase sigma factor (sigma-70 family)